jgi:isoleucyl-tRNA synthetase
MSKRLKNYPDPMSVVDKYGVDSLRLYFMSSPIMKAQNLNFSEKEVADIRRKVFIIWWNVFKFFKTFADQSIDVTQVPTKPTHIMDQWLLSKTQDLIEKTTLYMDSYDLVKASRTLMEFIDELSTWYLRLSRDRLRAKNNQTASHVFGFSIYTLACLMAPLAPFFSEVLYHNLVNEQSSIHLTDWPIVNKKLINQDLNNNMKITQQIVALARASRSESGIKLRQPLKKLIITLPENNLNLELIELIKQELNVKELEVVVGSEILTEFDFRLTKALKAEGEAREIMRSIQKLRKKSGLTITDQAKVTLPDWPANWKQQIEEKTNSILIKGEDFSLS